MARRAAQDEQAPAPSRNEVLLVGRVAAVAEERELPSGDLLSTFRLVVDRPPGVRGTAGGPPGHDRHPGLLVPGPRGSGGPPAA